MGFACGGRSLLCGAYRVQGEPCGGENRNGSKTMIAELFLIVFLLLCPAQGWAMGRLTPNYSYSASTPTYYPDCSQVDDFTPCQERWPDGKGISFYSGGKKHPSLKPKTPGLTVEWGACVQWRTLDGKGLSTFDLMNDLVFRQRDFVSVCVRQIGFRSDGVVVWRAVHEGFGKKPDPCPTCVDKRRAR